jgi:capsular exopolysaccharide synthesis family protein
VTFAAFVAMLRKRWAYVVVPLLLFSVAAGVASMLAQPIYSARASAYFSISLGQTASDLFQGSNYTQQQVGSYASLATQPIVLQPVIDELDLDTTPKELAHSVTATASAESVIVDITAADDDPEVAADIANAVTDELATVVRDLSPELGNGEPSVTVTTVAEATPPTYASSPNTRRNVLAAALAGLFLGVMAALAREKLDTRLRAREDLPDGINVLTSIEYDKSVRKAPAGGVVSSRRVAVRDESLRKLRTSLRFLDVDNPVKVFVMTSSVAGEGKTSMSLSLARVLAQDGQRVLLLDADMRRPKVAEYLAMEGAIGLADVLAGAVALDEAVQRWERDSLFVLPSGSIPPNPSELLGSHAMVELVARLRRSYDHVVVDAPPLLPVTDAAIASVHADGVVLVVRHGKTNRKQLRAALDALKAVEARLLGVVFNMTPPPRPWHKRSQYDYYRTAAVAESSRRRTRRAADGAGSAEPESVAAVRKDRV